MFSWLPIKLFFTSTVPSVFVNLLALPSEISIGKIESEVLKP